MPRDKKSGLGKGFAALFEDNSLLGGDAVSVIEPPKQAKKGAKSVQTGEPVYIDLNDIKPNAKQPRTHFDEAALFDLASSIKEHGVIEPVVLRPAQTGYEIVAGERRWRAARLAGLKTIPAVIRELDDRQTMFFALIENMQREDLNAVEEARALRELMDTFGLNQEEAAKSVGKSRPYVANALRLLKLPDDVLDLVEDGKLSAGHARAIAGLKGRSLQQEAAAAAVEGGWSVRQIEEYTGEKKPARKRRKAAKPDEVLAVEERLAERLGTKVQIKGSEKKGRIELEYFSREELDRLIEVLCDE